MSQAIAPSLLVRDSAVLPAESLHFAYQFVADKTRIQLSQPELVGLYREPETVTVQATGNAPVRVLSLAGDVLYAGVSPVQMRLRCGHYFVETEGDRTQFTVLPSNFAGADFFGASPGTFSAIPWVAALQNRTQPAWARVSAGGWKGLQPERNTWNWRELDEAVNVNRGRQIIVVADTPPDWVGNEEFVDRYAEYTGELARHFDGKIRAIEIWNEPAAEVLNPRARIPGVHDVGSLVRRYVELLRASRTAIRRASSSIQVIGPAWAHPFLKAENTRFVELGGARLLDGFSWHDYSMNHVAPDADGPGLLRLDKRLSWYRSLYGDMPFIVDELGLYGQSALGIRTTESGEFVSPQNWYRGMCRTIKAVVMMRAGGVVALLPHCFHGTTLFPKQMEIAGWDQSPPGEIKPRGPKPQTAAFLMTCYWLNGAKLIASRCLRDRLFVYEWRRANGAPLIFAWCREGASVQLSPPAGGRVTDVFGQEMTATVLREEPLLFHTDVTLDGFLKAITPLEDFRGPTSQD